MAATKKPGKREAIQQVAEGQGEAIGKYTQPGHARATVAPQQGLSGATSGPTPIRKIRIADDQWDALRGYARGHGLSTSAALRLALSEFLRDRGVR